MCILIVLVVNVLCCDVLTTFLETKHFFLLYVAMFVIVIVTLAYGGRKEHSRYMYQKVIVSVIILIF
jgi:hypothetical protein